MRVAIVYNRIEADSAPDERDVLDQVQAVAAALESLGHSTFSVPCSLNLEALRRLLEKERPHCVFNLVESLGGQGRLAHLAPALFEAMDLPYTGSTSMALLSTNHKVLAKDRMAAGGLPTPDWIGPWPVEPQTRYPAFPAKETNGARWIVKSVWEHASFGIEDTGLIDTRHHPEPIWEVLRLRAGAMGGACFAERYVDGREFNLAVLAGSNQPQVLPPAEIRFEDYPASKPRIVGYRAKWDAQAFEYHHTPRCFDFPPRDRELLERLQDAAGRCWKMFGLGGYARVDFRVDGRGRPYILEVNANPCLSPDAGFAAALQQAAIPYSQAIARILADAFRAADHKTAPEALPSLTIRHSVGS
ncbi:MAG TPA: D-alanine--D-alanine ligase [Desulfobacterales bacterium]